MDYPLVCDTSFASLLPLPAKALEGHDCPAAALDTAEAQHCSEATAATEVNQPSIATPDASCITSGPSKVGPWKQKDQRRFEGASTYGLDYTPKALPLDGRVPKALQQVR